MNQVSQLDVPIQTLIQKEWIKVASADNPRSVGATDTCDMDNPDNNNAVLAVFEGLEYEFIYEINEAKRFIRLINCEKITLFDQARDIRVEL